LKYSETTNYDTRVLCDTEVEDYTLNYNIFLEVPGKWQFVDECEYGIELFKPAEIRRMQSILLMAPVILLHCNKQAQRTHCL
jgi:hypothetical protein